MPFLVKDLFCPNLRLGHFSLIRSHNNGMYVILSACVNRNDPTIHCCYVYATDFFAKQAIVVLPL